MTCECCLILWHDQDFLIKVSFRSFTNGREKLSRSKVSQCPGSWSSDHWMGRGKETKRKTMKSCSAGRDTGTCLVISVDPTFLIIFQISQTLPCVIRVTIEQKKSVQYNRDIEINGWWPNSVSTPKAFALNSAYLGQLKEKRWERTTELKSRNAV